MPGISTSSRMRSYESRSICASASAPSAATDDEIALLPEPPGEHVSIVVVVVDNEQCALPRHWTAGLASSDVILSISG